jgi:AcrR family transcriptional regulator
MSIDLRVVKTRETIQTQMIRLLETVPFEKITVNQLILACRINRSTFYRNYEDKYDLIRKICKNSSTSFRMRCVWILLPCLY